jgi:hypothetical protein
MMISEKIMALSVLKMEIGVYAMAEILSESEALRIGMVLNDSSHRLLRQKAEEMRPPAPLGDVGAQ